MRDGAMAKIRIAHQLALLLLLLSSGSAWASDGARQQHNNDIREVVQGDGSLWSRWAAAAPHGRIGGGVMAADELEAKRQIVRSLEREQDRLRLDKQRRRRASDEAAAAAAAAAAAQITPAPELPECLRLLHKRQDNNGQIQALSAQIQSISLVASSVSQASRQVSQTSQQLSQSVQQLTQSTSRLSQSIQDLQQSAQQAQQSAQQAQDQARQAQQSASSAVSAAQSSAASSAEAAINANLASVTSAAAASISSMMAAASQSASNLMNAASSQVQAAKADATIARADAQSQVQQAQGAAVSVTQAALAVVGTFVGTSLLTILTFYLVLRHKQNRRRRSRELAISYPRQNDGAGDSETSFAQYGGGADIKVPRDPPPVMAGANRGSLGSVQDVGGLIGNPPAAAKKTATPAYGLFPKTPSPAGSGRQQQQPPDSPTSRYSADGASQPLKQPPSLQQWLREGTVSPFGTLRRDGPAGGKMAMGGGGSNWPFGKKAQGVGGVNAGGGGGKVMEPSRGLPLRDSSS